MTQQPRHRLRLLLEDLCERRNGHRNVTDEYVDHAYSEMDADGNGEVSQREFLAYFGGSKLSNAKILSYSGGA